jgi:hypothetical protein
MVPSKAKIDLAGSSAHWNFAAAPENRRRSVADPAKSHAARCYKDRLATRSIIPAPTGVAGGPSCGARGRLFFQHRVVNEELVQRPGKAVVNVGTYPGTL